MTKKTVDNHLENIRSKLGVNSKSMILLKLLEKGLIGLSYDNESTKILNNLINTQYKF